MVRQRDMAEYSAASNVVFVTFLKAIYAGTPTTVFHLQASKVGFSSHQVFVFKR